MLRFEGVIPELSEGQTVEGICEHVFNILVNDERAINDLSLPPSEKLNHNFGDHLGRVLFRFVKVGRNEKMELSYTEPIVGAGDTGTVAEVFLFYSELEEESMKEMIEARILHEATHALRYAVIRNAEKTGVSSTKLEIPTPEKPRNEFAFAAARESEPPLYKLETDSFHSGYWMEHIINSGIWVILLGELLDDDENVVTLPAEGICFKIIRKMGKVKVLQSDGSSLAFTKLCGYEKGQEEPKVLCHLGKRVTWCADDESCAKLE